ncbi:ABC transporter ATP-binding protein [Parvicella tangerina]|uniref:Vitamin B12 import ATP-binding protein BtuD n=1 Tax=Parvicella tangerina TaxID=2829795 RepID=A0A916NG01_9FLAO|nr:ABC transporter ATP-binding protein [Parvicella tangerina]CAG5079697.1 Vitamin B12 import ATP-binding protein BtuD [Parvicella tangerina]
MKEDKEVLIKVEGVSKKFARNLRKSLRYGVQDLTREVFGMARVEQLRKSEFWALDDVNFEIRRGECLGLIGHNGAGKSTILKIINGLLKPDKGRVTVKGKVAALIELGAGFNPILTGRENIYNNASVLGFTKEETDAKLDDIIAFSEIGEFIDAPVQSYSSGMKVRLGFSVAAQMDPDVLIIDEVLAVGDVFFRNKCIARIDQLKKNCAIIFVSHSINLVGRICTAALVMDKGKVVDSGNSIGESYLKFLELRPNTDSYNPEGSLLSSIHITQDGQRVDQVHAYSLIDIHMEFTHKLDAYINIVLFDISQRPVITILHEDYNNVNGKRIVIKDFAVNLVPGKYSFSVNINKGRNDSVIEKITEVGSFKVLGEDFLWSPLVIKQDFDVQE